MNKKLGRLLGKVFADKRSRAGTELGACCFNNGAGFLFCLDSVSQSECPAGLFGQITGKFHPGKKCDEVCPEGEDVLYPQIEPEDINPTIKPEQTNTDDGGSGGGDEESGGSGGGPTPCPTSPTTIPNDCEREASEVAMCLEILQTGNNADQPTAKLLRGLVVGWGRFRCPEVRALCYHAENGNVGCYLDLTLTDMNCFCRIHNEYWRGIKNIVNNFCAGSINGEVVRKRLADLCKQLKLARRRCQGNDQLPKDPISNADNTGSLNCGIKRVD